VDSKQLPQSTHLGKKKLIMHWLTMGLVLIAVQGDAQLRIHRVLPDPMGNESRNDTPEIIEVRNYGGKSVELEGWSLQSTPPEEPDVWEFPSLVLDPEITVTVHWKAPIPDAADRHDKGP
jgi:hypothetical protein